MDILINIISSSFTGAPMQAIVVSAIYSHNPPAVSLYFFLNALQLACIFLLLCIIYLSYKDKRKFTGRLEDLKKVERDVITHLLDSLSANFALVNPDGTILYINQRIYKDLDINRKDVLGKKITDVLSIFYDQKDILPDIMRELNEGKERIDLRENTFFSEKNKDAVEQVEGTAFNLSGLDGKLQHILFFFQNINMEKKREYTWDMILQKTNIFPWTIDIETGIFTIDSRYFDYLGIPNSRDRLTIEDFRNLIHPDDVNNVFTALEEQINGASLDAFVSYRLHKSDSSWEWFEAQSTFMKSVSGSPFQLVGICMSTQKYKDTEIRLQEALQSAKQSEELKTAFLANMSHEIRTPLNAILGFSSLLTSGDMDLKSDEAKVFASIIDQNGQSLLSLISDILDLSRIESNTMTFDLQSYSLNALLTDIYKTQAFLIPPGVKLVLQIPDEDTYIQTDSLRLSQVVNNLINNARKFTEKGTIRLGYLMEKQKNEIILFVEDTGCGMDETQLSQIFNRFYKGSPHIQGTGLGLPICKTIVEKLNGMIRVVSSRGIGTVVSMHFELYAP